MSSIKQKKHIIIGLFTTAMTLAGTITLAQPRTTVSAKYPPKYVQQRFPAKVVTPATPTPVPKEAEIKVTDEPEDPSDYKPGTVEAEAYRRRADLPNPAIKNAASIETLSHMTSKQKGEYFLKVCPLYVQAYEAVYLSKLKLTKPYSPFITFCRRRWQKMGNQSADQFLLTQKDFKITLDREAIIFEQELLALTYNQMKTDSIVPDMEKRMIAVEQKTKVLEHELSQTQEALNSAGGFLKMTGLSPGISMKLLEGLVLILFGICGFLLAKNLKND